MKKILYFVAEDSCFCSHRLDLASFMKRSGYDVAVAARFSSDYYKKMILDQNLKFFELRHFHRTSIWNIFKEVISFKELYDVYQEFKPDLVHHVALKPIIYGTLIAKLCKIKKVVNAVAGLGFVFTNLNHNFDSKSIIKVFKDIIIKIKQKFLKIILCKLLKIIIKDHILLLQNEDDLEFLKNHIGIDVNQTSIFVIPGSGLIMDKYYQSAPLTESSFNNGIKVVLLSRLLWTKGIYEFVQAAKQIKEYIKNNNLNIIVEFILYGDIDHSNPAKLDYSELAEWSKQNLVSWRNFCKNPIAAYSDCHIVVLPSYREGLPKSLLEAAACARPIITTDVPGCREIVKDGVNGYLVPQGNSQILAFTLIKLMQDPQLMINMGKFGREIIINNFSSQIIFPKTLEMYLS